MKLLVEGHPYPFESIRELFPNIDELDVVDGVASVNYVGYYYYAEKSQAVFILPKVVIDHRDNLFGVEGLRPEHVINLDEPGNPLDKRQHDFTAVQRGQRQKIHNRNVRRQYARN